MCYDVLQQRKEAFHKLAPIGSHVEGKPGNYDAVLTPSLPITKIKCSLNEANKMSKDYCLNLTDTSKRLYCHPGAYPTANGKECVLPFGSLCSNDGTTDPKAGMFKCGDLTRYLAAFPANMHIYPPAEFDKTQNFKMNSYKRSVIEALVSTYDKSVSDKISHDK